MIVERNINGSVSVSVMVNGGLRTVTYYFESEYHSVESFMCEETGSDESAKEECREWLENNPEESEESEE